MGGDGISLVAAMGLQRHHEVKVALVGVRLPLLAHVVARGLGEVEAPDRDLVGVLALQVNSIRTRRKIWMGERR